jgi:hypothetical protein
MKGLLYIATWISSLVVLGFLLKLSWVLFCAGWGLI